MRHLVLALFLATMAFGLIALFNSLVIYAKTKDRNIRYFLILFLGLSGQIIANIAINYYLVVEGKIDSPWFAFLFSLANASLLFMATAIVHSTNLICGNRHAKVRDILSILVSSFLFFLSFFAYRIDTAASVITLNGLKYIVLYLPAAILYATMEGGMKLRKVGDPETKKILTYLVVCSAIFFPFFCFSCIRVLVKTEMRIGFDMFSMLPFSLFYLLICAAFVYYLNQKYFSLLSGVGDDFAVPDEAFFREHRITDREREVMLLILQGSDNKRIARLLEISVNTVKVHTSSIFRKLGVQSRFELTKFRGSSRTNTGLRSE